VRGGTRDPGPGNRDPGSGIRDPGLGIGESGQGDGRRRVDGRWDGEGPAGRAAWAARGLFAAAVVAGVLWLFLGYEPPRTKAHPGREKVVFWHMWTAHWAQVIQNIVERFNQGQDRYEVVALTVSGGSLKTLIATAGGDPPDCMAQWESVIPAWAERGALTPLDELMGPDAWADLRDRLYPAVRAIGTYKDRFYGLSTGMNIWALYYRPSHFREAGLDPDRFPQTIEELDAVAGKLYKYDEAGRIVRIGFSPRWLHEYAPVFGGTFYDADRGELTLTHPRNLAALEWMVGYARRYGFEKVDAFQSGLASTLGATWPFISGAYSIALEGQWRVEDLARYGPDVDYRTVPVPPPAAGKALAGWSNGNFLVIPSGARQKAGALAFMKFWSGVENPERAAEFYTWGGWLPITPDVARAPLYQAYVRKHPPFQTFVDTLASPNVQVTPPVPIQAYLMHRLTSAEDAALRGTLTPQAALERVAREVERELALQRAARE